MAEDQRRAAAYVPWATFKGSLDQLSKGMPSRIDRTVFPGLAWNVQSQLFASLKFFGLLKGEDEPTPALHDLVTGNEVERKAKFKKAVEDTYSELIAIDLTKATRGHFEEELGRLYNVTGDTRVKAVRFFLSAASYVGIPLSAFIVPKEGKSKGAPRRPRTAGPRVMRRVNGHITPPVPTADATAGTSRTVQLESGGDLTLSATLDLFSLNSEDRKFVFGLIDTLEAYAAKKVSS